MGSLGCYSGGEGGIMDVLLTLVRATGGAVKLPEKQDEMIL